MAVKIQRVDMYNDRTEVTMTEEKTAGKGSENRVFTVFQTMLTLCRLQFGIPGLILILG